MTNKKAPWVAGAALGAAGIVAAGVPVGEAFADSCRWLEKGSSSRAAKELAEVMGNYHPGETMRCLQSNLKLDVQGLQTDFDKIVKRNWDSINSHSRLDNYIKEALRGGDPEGLKDAVTLNRFVGFVPVYKAIRRGDLFREESNKTQKEWNNLNRHERFAAFEAAVPDGKDRFNIIKSAAKEVVDRQVEIIKRDIESALSPYSLKGAPKATYDFS
jgi:hypothetical protein